MKPEDRIKFDKKDLITKWLSEEGFEVGDGEGEELLWAIAIAPDKVQGFPVFVAQTKDSSDRVALRVQFRIKNGLMMSKLPKPRQNTLIKEMCLYMMSLDVEYHGLEPGTEEILLSLPIYYDALTKDTFMSRLRRIRNAAILIKIVLIQIHSEIIAFDAEGEDVN